MPKHVTCPKCNSGANIKSHGSRLNHETAQICKVYRCVPCTWWFDVYTDTENKWEKQYYKPDLWWEDLPKKVNHSDDFRGYKDVEDLDIHEFLRCLDIRNLENYNEIEDTEDTKYYNGDGEIKDED